MAPTPRSEALYALHEVGREVKRLLAQQTGIVRRGDPAPETHKGLVDLWIASDARHEPSPPGEPPPGVAPDRYRSLVRGLAVRVEALLGEVADTESKDPLVVAAKTFVKAAKRDP